MNFGTTTLALAGGGAGRTSVLVFTMPFWTLVIARIVLGERVRGAQWIAVALAFAGLTLVVAPWDWHGDLAPEAVGGAVGPRLGGRQRRDEALPAAPSDRPAQLPRLADARRRAAAHAARARARRPADALERARRSR